MIFFIKPQTSAVAASSESAALASFLRMAAQASCLTIAALVLTACAGARDGYSGAAMAQERAQAENAANAENAETTAKAGNEAKPGAAATLDTPATYQKLVEQMQQKGLWYASLAHIDAMEQRWGSSPASIRLRADALRQTDQPADSARFYQQLMGTPLEAAGYHGLGLLAGGRADFTEAARLMEQARRTRPADAVLLGDLGYAQLRAGHMPEARLRLMQALQLMPTSTQAQLNLALYFEVASEPAQALAVMDANHMSEAARAAVREAALQMPGRRPADGALPVPERSSAPLTAPMTLKASGWGGLSGQQNPSVSDPSMSSAHPLSSSESSP